MALPAKFRFRTRREIQTVIRSGARRVLPIGVLYYRIQSQSPSRRFLAVVPSRVSKRSSLRHRGKRRVEGLFSRHAGKFPVGFAGVCVLSPPVANFSPRDLASAFERSYRALTSGRS